MGDGTKDDDMAADGQRVRTAAQRRWSNLDRGWRASVIALAVVLFHLAAQFP